MTFPGWEGAFGSDSGVCAMHRVGPQWASIMRSGSQPRITTPSLTSHMQPPPHPWTAEDGVRWSQYADAMYAWLGRKGPHPGHPPAGYCEHYKVHTKHAPCPEDFPGQIPAAQNVQQPPAQQAPRAIAHLAGPGVHMSDDAFAAWMNHASSLHTHLANIAFESTRMAGHAVDANATAVPAPPHAVPVAPRAMLQVPPWRGRPPAATRRGGFAAGFQSGRGGGRFSSGMRGGRAGGGRGGGHGHGGFRGGHQGRAGVRHPQLARGGGHRGRGRGGAHQVAPVALADCIDGPVKRDGQKKGRK